ncbi:MAG TPA: DsrE family protein [Anaerolineales bacterium]|nr:DsrE family protein [Anaerolineales bacterium]
MHKVAIIILSEMEEHGDLGRVTNALGAVKEFKQHGDDVKLIFDGGGVTSAVRLADPEHKMHRLYSQVEDKLTGVCRYCSRAFHVYEEARELELPFLAEFEQHPSIRNLITEGYQVITF